MNLSLTTINKALTVANEIANKLTEEYDIHTEARCYSTSDDRKGIRFVLYDINGNRYTEYVSGIHNNLDDLISAITSLYHRILDEQYKS